MMQTMAHACEKRYLMILFAMMHVSKIKSGMHWNRNTKMPTEHLVSATRVLTSIFFLSVTKPPRNPPLVLDTENTASSHGTASFSIPNNEFENNGKNVQINSP